MARSDYANELSRREKLMHGLFFVRQSTLSLSPSLYRVCVCCLAIANIISGRTFYPLPSYVTRIPQYMEEPYLIIWTANLKNPEVHVGGWHFRHIN